MEREARLTQLDTFDVRLRRLEQGEAVAAPPPVVPSRRPESAEVKDWGE